MSNQCSSGSLRHKHPYLKEVHGGLTYMVKGFPEEFITAIHHRKGDCNGPIVRIEIIPSKTQK
jgi:hypothetical protein